MEQGKNSSSTEPAKTRGWAALVSLSALASAAALVCCRAGFGLLDYPWLFPDSFDWLANGLRYADSSLAFPITHRAIFFPLFAAGFFKLGWEHLLIHYGLLSYLLGALFLFCGLRRAADPRTAGLACLYYLFCSNVLGQSLYVGSDVMANAVLSGALLFFLSYLLRDSLRDLGLAAILAGLSIHMQYILPVVAPLVPVFIWLKPRADTRIGFSAIRVRRLLITPRFYLILLAGLMLAGGPLLPRLIKFGLLYTEAVAHGSLVSLNAKQPFFYLTSLPAVFSLPLLVLAAGGGWLAVRDRPKRLTACFMLAWAACVCGFFTFLYTWLDIRFLLYLSTPIFYFAAEGTARLLDALQRIKAPARLMRAIGAAGVAAVALAGNCNPTLDPFDAKASLTPFLSLTPKQGWHWKIAALKSKPFYHRLYRTARRRHVQQAPPDFDNLYFSKPVLRLLQSLRRKLKGTPLEQRVYFLASLPPHAPYIVNNRNLLYYRQQIQLTASDRPMPKALEDGPVVLVTNRVAVAQLGLPFAAELGRAADYAAGTVTQASFATWSAAGGMLPEIRAEIFAEKLMNGIHNDPNDWAAAAYGKPIEVRFARALDLNQLAVKLYDLDGRSYRFRVEGLAAGEWKLLYQTPREGAGGRVVISFPPASLQALRLIGTYNSAQAQNPRNTVFHVMELELAAAR